MEMFEYIDEMKQPYDIFYTDCVHSELHWHYYSEEYTKLVEATSPNKVAALTEVGYIPDIHLLEKSHTPWAYYMTWSEEFCIGEKFNSNENLKAMYDSQYAVTGK